MSYAVKGFSTDRGLDAAAFTLVAYGGAGPLHASAIAREIGMRRFIVPRAPGHFCAFGMLHADLRYDYVRSWFVRLEDLKARELERRFAALARPGLERLGRRKARVAYALDMRYVGQEHPVTVELPRGTLAAERIKALFDAEHLRRYGTHAPAERAMQRVGKPLGLSVTEAAEGILRIASTAMSYAVKGVTTERGLDAGDFVLVAYGGAGPLHAVAVAREIGIRNVIIPGAPGVFSAFGMLFSDLRYDYVRTHLMQLADAPFSEIEAVFKEL